MLLELMKWTDKKRNKYYAKRLGHEQCFTSISETEYNSIKSQYTNEDIYESFGNGVTFSITYKIKP